MSVNNSIPPVQGVKWFKDILNDNNRQYGVDVHTYLPSKEVVFPPFGFDATIYHPQERDLIRQLSQFYGESPVSRVYPEAYAATVERAYMVGNTGVVITPDGYIIAETASNTGYIDNRCLNVDKIKELLPTLENRGHIDGNVLSVANPNTGYSHHLIESFFSIIWFDGLPVDYVQTTTGANEERVVEFLHALGIPSSCCFSISPVQICSADQVSFFGPNSYFLLRDETLKKVKNVLIEPRLSAESSIKRIYFETRLKAGYAKDRLPANEPALKEILQDSGYDCIDPADLTINEKIAILGQSEEVISFGGSGICNALFFCSPTAKIGSLLTQDKVTMSLCSHIGNRLVVGYNDIPIFPVYPYFCGHNGYLMNFAQVGKFLENMVNIYTYPERTFAKFFSISSLPNSTINIKAFQEWLECFRSC